MELSQDVHHRPIVFIRFNPDKYVDEEGNTLALVTWEDAQGAWEAS